MSALFVTGALSFAIGWAVGRFMYRQRLTTLQEQLELSNERLEETLWSGKPHTRPLSDSELRGEIREL